MFRVKRGNVMISAPPAIAEWCADVVSRAGVAFRQR